MPSKISVSLPESDLAVLDALVRQGLATGRSGAIRLAIDHMRGSALEARLAEQLLASFDEEDASEADLWDSTAGDGL